MKAIPLLARHSQRLRLEAPSVLGDWQEGVPEATQIKRQWLRPEHRGRRALPQGWQGWAGGPRELEQGHGTQTDSSPPHPWPPRPMCTLSLFVTTHTFRKRCQPTRGADSHSHPCTRAHITLRRHQDTLLPLLQDVLAIPWTHTPTARPGLSLRPLPATRTHGGSACAHRDIRFTPHPSAPRILEPELRNLHRKVVLRTEFLAFCCSAQVRPPCYLAEESESRLLGLPLHVAG